MEPEAEAKLRKEISYLTRLIEAHKAIKTLQSEGTTATVATTVTTTRGTLKRVRLGSAIPSWSHSGSISCHLPSCKSSSLPSASRNPSLHKPLPNTTQPLQMSSNAKKPHPHYPNRVYKPGLHVDQANSFSESGSRPHPQSNLPKDGRDNQMKRTANNEDRKSDNSVNCVGQSQSCDNSADSEAMDLSISAVLSSGREMEEKAMPPMVAIGTKRDVDQRDTGTQSSNGRPKRMKLTNSQSQSTYLWKPNTAKNDQVPRKKLRQKIPDRSKLKWRKDEEGGAFGGSVAVGSENTLLTTSCRTIPVASIVSRKRRRSSSGGPSPFIIRKYKMLRVSSLNKGSPSFSERRLQYLINQSLHSPCHTSKKRRLSATVSPTRQHRKRKSVHRVWKPQETEAEGSVGREEKTLLDGFETKTKQGNKQWVSLAAAAKSNGVRSRRRRGGRMKKNHVVNVMGGEYVMASSGKSLKKVATKPSCSSVLTLPAVSKFTPKKRRLSSSSSASCLSAKRQLANSMVKRSVNRVWSSKQAVRSTTTTSTNQFCIYYNRFGHCNRGDKCTFIHDPKRVAICSKFLRGVCDKLNGNCPFSHNVSKEKMPVCSFFLRGLCTRDQCPYLHVNVGQDAELCLDFVRGYCSLGEECKKQHVVVCPEFLNNGSCPRGKTCPLRHRKKRQRSNSSVFNQLDDVNSDTYKTLPNSSSKSISSVKEPYSFRRVRHKLENKIRKSKQTAEIASPTQLITPAQLEFIPLETNEVPEFIAL